MSTGKFRWKRALCALLGVTMVLPISPVATHTNPVAAAGTTLYTQDFEAFAPGADPAGFVDTAANNSMASAESLFAVTQVGSTAALTTTSSSSNIHSHVVGPNAQPFDSEPGYVFTGAMRIDSPEAGIGVTFFSDYPNTDSYYRLRRFGNGGSFHLSPHGTSITSGVTDSGVVPVPGQWYRFEIEVTDTGSATTIKAKVWADGAAVPTAWQIDASDSSASRQTSGTVGAWSYLSGARHWDDLAVSALGPVGPHSITLTTAGNGTVGAAPDLAAHPHGSTVAITATPDPGWNFVGWSGDLSGSQNPADVVMNSDANITAHFAEPSDDLLDENFEFGAVGSDPAGWRDTAANNSMVEADELFDIAAVGGTQALGTSSTASNIHSHYVGAGAASASNYEVTGRMWMTSATSGIGVTVLSDYPATDSYYRIRRYGAGGDFHLSPHGTTMTGGTTASGVVPTVDTWYRFRVQVIDTGSQTEIRARLWADGTAEPGAWQIDAFDSSSARLTAGTVGVWSWGSGSKAWDDLHVSAPGPAARYTLTTDSVGAGSVSTSPTAADYAHGDAVTLSAVPDPGWEFSAWSGSLTGTSNPATITITSDQSITATFDPIPTHDVTTNTVGNGSVTLDPDQVSYPEGTTLTATAVPDAGWVFSGWSGGVQGSANPATLTVDGDTTLTATFVEAGDRTLTINTTGAGTATASPAQPTYQVGDTVTVTAVPDEGWSFTRWDTDPVVDVGWWDSQWSYRLPVSVDSGGTDRSDVIADIGVDFTAAWAALGVSDTFDPDSLRVIEVDQGEIIDAAVPFQFDPSSNFDANGSAVGTLSVLLGGNTAAGATRSYHVYFDSTSKGIGPATIAPLVVTTDGIIDEGLDTVRVQTDVGSYYFDKDGGGFSSIVDIDGNDWIGHNAAFGSAGSYRGVPNLVYPEGYMHPGEDGVTTTIVSQGPLKTTLRAEADGGAWVTLWEIRPTSARMTVLAAPADYWFLYEGTPGGSLDLASDVVVRSDGTQTTAGQAWSGDLSGEEWVYFGDPNVGAGGRSLYVVNHVDDGAVDSYYPMEGNMTVLGFGRSGTARYLDAVPSTFTLGITEGVDFPSVSSELRSEFRDLATSVGPAETASAAASSPTLTFEMTGDQIVTAVFDEIQPVTLDLATTGNGTIAAVPDQPTYQPGDVVTITASAASGSYFSGWSGDQGGTTNPLTLTLAADTVIVANFAQDGLLTIETSTTGDGSIQLSPDQATYDSGQQVTVTAIAANGSVFTSWGGDLSGSANPQTITVDGSNSISAVFDLASANAPIIDVWYGDTQEFGKIGHPQRWQNILGNVSDPDGISSLTYRLNGGPIKTLSIGPDTRRLARPGDFNVDLDDQDLVEGDNTVLITAVDSTGASATRTVTVDHASGNVWPSSYTIDWSTASDIHDVAQPIDGEWVLEPGGVRSIQPAYDRLIGVGDVTWTDYEVEFPVTVHSVDDSGFTSHTSGGAGLGVLMRWNGHTDVPVVFPQPKTGYLPYGAIGWYWWTNPESARLRIDGNNQVVLDSSSSSTPPTVGVEYMIKMRVTTEPGVGGLYQLKSWPSNQAEPAGWQLSGQETMSDPQSGSIMLLAHHIDATFGDVQITPLGQTTGSIATATVGDGAVVVDPAKAEYAYGEEVTVTALPDPGWEFTGWQGDLTGTTNPQSISLTGDKQVTAVFAAPSAAPVISDVAVQEFTTSAVITWTTDKMSSSSVASGPTSAYGTDVSDPALVTTHSVTLSGLDPATTYHYSVTSVDGSANASSSPDATFTTLDGDNPSGLTSDDFNSCAVDADVWTLIDPVGDGTVVVDGTSLELSVPGGVAHDVWTGGNNALRLMQDVNDDDFEFEVKFDSVVSSAYQLQGLLVEQDASNYLRFDFYGYQGSTYLFAAKFVNGTPTVIANVVVDVGAPSHMRVTRVDDDWVQQWSVDGVSWNTNAAFSLALNVDAVGVFAGNAGGNAPAHTAVIDYAFDTASPILPEDGVQQDCDGGGAGGDTTPPNVTDVQQTSTTDSATITWTTDEPASSSVSFGPTASHGTVVAAPTLVTSHSITLTGLSPSTTYHFAVTSEDEAGNAATTSDDVFTTAQPVLGSIVSDDFDVCAVDTGLWTVVDPIGDGSVAVDGSSMLLSVPAGIAHDVWNSANNSVRATQAVADEDFGFEVKYDSVVADSYEMQGILVGQDENDFLRFDFYGFNGRTYLFAARFVDGNPTVLANVRVQVGSTSFMRITRTGDTWVQEWSTDGTSWTTNVAFSHSLDVAEVSVFAGNAGGSAPAHTAVVDYAFNTASPIVPEDPSTPTCS